MISLYPKITTTSLNLNIEHVLKDVVVLKKGTVCSTRLRRTTRDYVSKRQDFSHRPREQNIHDACERCNSALRKPNQICLQHFATFWPLFPWTHHGVLQTPQRPPLADYHMLLTRKETSSAAWRIGHRRARSVKGVVEGNNMGGTTGVRHDGALTRTSI